MTVPTLTPRAAREQQAFRSMLDAMARPGTVAAVLPHEQGGEFAGAVALLEALLDHEVAFAVVPGNPPLEEVLLRLTGSSLTSAGHADYLAASGSGIETALREAKEGHPEYPDRGATIIASVEHISAQPGTGEPVVLAGPGIQGTLTTWIAGFPPSAQELFRERHTDLPLGIDLILIAPDGSFTCLPRYTQIMGGD